MICPLQSGVVHLDQIDIQLWLSHHISMCAVNFIVGMDKMKIQQASLLPGGNGPAEAPPAALPAEPGHGSVSRDGAQSGASHDGEAELRKQLEVSLLASTDNVV